VTVLSASQIAAYATAAGFNASQMPIAVAIALTESSGNTTAYNPETAAGTPLGSGSRGLWQIYGYAHQQYNNNTLYDPLINAKAAYGVSNKGTNWNPWSSYTSGAYKSNITKAPPQVTQANSTPTPTGSVKPWWFFPRIDNYGEPDPYGGFPKPDSNIQVPANYPIIALLSGTVSGINSPSGAIPDWGAVITLLLDKPLNAHATHTAYLHLASVASGLKVGSSVQAGQLVGYNGGVNAAGAQKVPLGFALYQGSYYGFDQWNPGDPLLNMTPLLNSAANGQIPVNNASGGFLTSVLSSVTGSTSLPTYVPTMQQIHQTLISTPGFYGIALALDEAEEMPGWIDLTVKQPDISFLGQDTGASPPDFNGLIRSVGATIEDNFLGVGIRSGLVILGVALLFGLFAKVIKGPLVSLTSNTMAG
jgi:hypothetical protein